MVCIVILIGFAITAVISYRANYSTSLRNIEQVSSLTSESIYYQIASVFTKPVNISLTMANDSLLKEYLFEETKHLDDADYTRTIQTYLETYRKKYQYDSVFLASTATGRYYNFNGVDRILQRGDPENVWFYELLDRDADYAIAVDNDEVAQADNEVTVFVNCKIRDARGTVLGVVGVGLRVDSLQALLRGYEEQFGIRAFLVDTQGEIEISTQYTGYEKKNLFAVYAYDDDTKRRMLDGSSADAPQRFWAKRAGEDSADDYVVARYIPELSWHLVVEHNIGPFIAEMRQRFYVSVVVVVAVIALILLVITSVIRKFKLQILKLSQEQQEIFRKATEQLYDDINELDITENCAVGKKTERYFQSLGVPEDMPYDKALQVIAQKQIKEEFREGYIAAFHPDNVKREYERGQKHLRYEFMMREEGSDYFWMRIDAYAYYRPEEQALRMFTYRKNIDAEKRRELAMLELAQSDEMTRLYSKAATRRQIERRFAEESGQMHAFFMLDIDDFKQVNDRFGHAFGDLVIIEFARTLKQQFRATDVVGRVGGDEFAVFVSIPDEAWALEKVQELSAALRKTCTVENASWQMSASIGVALAPRDGANFEMLYKSADAALYETKKRGKNGYTFCAGPAFADKREAPS